MSLNDPENPLEPEDDLDFLGRRGKTDTIFLLDLFNITIPQKIKTEVDTIDFFSMAVKTCRQFILNNIIKNKKDLVGVVLYGTSTTYSETNFKGVKTLLSLSYPGAEELKLLDLLSGSTEESKKMREAWGRNEDYCLADALWQCSSLFDQGAQEIDKKRVVLMTTKAEPHDDEKQLHLTRQRAMDLKERKISLEVIGLGEEFQKQSKFYKELIQDFGQESSYLQPCMTEEEILSKIERSVYKNRRYARLRWKISDDLHVGVSLYFLYNKETSQQAKDTLNRENNEPVQLVNQFLDEETSEVLLPPDIEEVAFCAGTEVVFKTEDKETSKHIMDPALHLLDVLPAESVGIETHCGHPKFACADDEFVSGSARFLKAFAKRLLKRNQVAFCALLTRKNASIKYVNLLPTLGDAETPFGFHVIPRPFISETREIEVVNSPSPNERLVDIAGQISKKLKFSYKPENFGNPSKKKFWSNAEALALDEESLELKIEDDTAVDVETQEERLGDLGIQFADAFSLPTEAPETKKHPQGRKRATPQMIETLVQEVTEAKHQKKLEDCRVEELRRFLSFHNVKTKGLVKSQLVAAIYNFK